MKLSQEMIAILTVGRASANCVVPSRHGAAPGQMSHCRRVPHARH